jgi:hypothetical protein
LIYGKHLSSEEPKFSPPFASVSFQSFSMNVRFASSLRGDRLRFIGSFLSPGRNHRRASVMFRGSEEPLRTASTHFIAPGGTRQRSSSPSQAPKSLSSNRHLTSKPHEAVHRASGQRLDSEETFRRSSTRLPAPGGVHQRV